jgi:cold shock CspA family protein
MIAIVTFDSSRGYSFCELEDTHQSIYVHISQVKDGRCLHVGDRISLDVVPNPKRPGQMMGGNVVYIGRIIARQTSGVNSGAL